MIFSGARLGTSSRKRLMAVSIRLLVSDGAVRSASLVIPANAFESAPDPLRLCPGPVNSADWSAVSNLCEPIRLRWLLPVCALFCLLAAAPKASAADNSMTISSSATAGGSCNAGSWTPTQDNANLNVDDIATCANGGPVTIGNGGTIDVQEWPSSLGVAVTLNGAATIETSMSGFSGLTVEGATSFSGAVEVDTTGAQTYESAVELGGDVTLANGGGAMTFDSTIDGAHALTVSAAGSVYFAGAIGSESPPTTVSVLEGGVVTQLGGNVTTTGSQDFGAALELESDVTFNSDSTVDLLGIVSGNHQIT